MIVSKIRVLLSLLLRRRTVLQHQQLGQMQGTAPAKVRDADPHFLHCCTLDRFVVSRSFVSQRKTERQNIITTKTGVLYETAEKLTYGSSECSTKL
jgi:hypothetical protein